MKMKLFILGLLILLCNVTNAQRAEDYKTIVKDGAWCWFSDPRSLYYEKTQKCTYTGFVTSIGDIKISAYNHTEDKTYTNLIYKKLQIDDHVNPSLLFLPDGRLMMFFTKHNGTLYYTTTLKPEDISAFSPVDSLNLGKMLCYTNPVLLTEENNRIYVFFRGGEDWKPTFITTDNYGKTWSKPIALVSKKINSSSNRPYTKIISDGKSSIHFAFTDGHPRDENHNSIYYLKYSKGDFFNAANKKIGSMKKLPIRQESVPKVYDGVTNNQRAWIWDVALNKENMPVIVYSTMPEETKHFYNYATWNGVEWVNKTICNAGSAFPRYERKKEIREPEPHYSGGIAIDHNNTNVVYVSRPINDRFEIEKWSSADNGKTFTSSPITTNSLKDNVRPYVVRNAPDNLVPRVLWMYNNQYSFYQNYNTSIKSLQLASRYSSDLSETDVRQVMTAVADWQMDNFQDVKHHVLDWTNGTLYVGMMEWAKIATDNKYMKWLYNIGNKNAWQPHKRMYHADDIVVSQLYLEMYKLREDDKFRSLILAPTEARLDYVLSHPSNGALFLDYKDAQTLERWSWCDALFMAPPVYAKMTSITADERYLAFMDKEFKATYDLLYDKEEHLFFRDRNYLPSVKLEANGRKIFWGRGNGWVMGGLVSILQELPQNSKYRPFYQKLFVDMANKIATCQDTNGFWRASMLDPDTYPNPETSSSAFFCYALAFGVNKGILEKEKFLPIINKSWKALASTVYSDGKLGWVQPIGENPKNVKAEMTEVYGVGAFLLAGTEVLKILVEKPRN